MVTTPPEDPPITPSSTTNPAHTPELTFEQMLAGMDEDDSAISPKTASDLEAVFDVPVRLSVVLGRARMAVSSLLKMDTGTVIELDKQVGEPVEILINGRLIAHGEIVLVDGHLGVTMTEIVKDT